jgi:hypothetical protein
MEEKRKNTPRTPLSSPLLSARCRPAWSRHRLPTVPCRHDQAPPARPQGRRAWHRRCTSPGPPCAGHLLDILAPALLAYKSPPPITQLKPHQLQQPPRHLLFPQFSSVQRSQLRRRATGRGWRHRIRPPLGERTPGSGGGVPQEPFPPRAVKLCFPYAPRRRRRLPLCMPVSSLPRRWTRRRCAVGLESNGRVPVRSLK